jgi:hypothetical protein
VERESRIPATISNRALEMVMRDVLDGLEEISLEQALSGSGYGFEIVGTTSFRKEEKQQEPAAVIDFSSIHSAAG